MNNVEKISFLHSEIDRLIDNIKIRNDFITSENLYDKFKDYEFNVLYNNDNIRNKIAIRTVGGLLTDSYDFDNVLHMSNNLNLSGNTSELVCVIYGDNEKVRAILDLNAVYDILSGDIEHWGD